MYKRPQSEEYLKRITDAAMSVPTNSAALLILNAYASSQDWRPVLHKIDKPVIYAYSVADRSQAEAFRQKLPSARVEFFAGAGHALFIDEPVRFNALLAGFAAKLK